MITATEFKAKCLRFLDEVERTGTELVISKHGRPVAKLVTVGPERPWLALRGRGAFSGDPFTPVVEDGEIDALK